MPQVILPLDTLSQDIFPQRHFATGQIATGHFATWIFCHKDILPHDKLPQGISPHLDKCLCGKISKWQNVLWQFVLWQKVQWQNVLWHYVRLPISKFHISAKSPPILNENLYTIKIEKKLSIRRSIVHQQCRHC